MRFSISSMRLKRLFSAVAVLVAVIGLGLLASGKLSLYGQAGRYRVPDLTGTWLVNAPNGCGYQNILDTTVPPTVWFCGTPPDSSTEIEITEQSGRVFAGGHPGASDKLTGYLAPDGSVSVQIFSTSPHEMEHTFITGTLTNEKGSYVMRGYAHGISDLTIQSPYTPYMYTVEVTITKQ